MGCDLSFLNKVAGGRLDKDEQGNVILDKKLLLLGLDNAGKTSMLLQYKENQFSSTVPTVGLNVEQIKFRCYCLTLWDVGGQATKLWKHYFDHIDAVVFVVDSTSDDKYLNKAKQELHKIMKDPSLQSVPVLLMFNKSDLSNSPDFKSKETVEGALDITSLTENRQLKI